MTRVTGRSGRAVCPRCGDNLSMLDGICTSRVCSWPNPEPGTITALRVRIGARADLVLQRLRAQGRWPK